MRVISKVADDLADIVLGLRKIPMAFWLATEDMRSRYTRTALGPWWNVLSTVVFVAGMALTFGALFRQPLETYLPYLAASMACWGFVSGCINDGCGILPRAAGLIQSYPLPLSSQVFRTVADKVLLLSHFLLVYLAVAIIMGVPLLSPALLFFIPAMVIYIVGGVGVCLALSVLGARYRDLGPAIGSIMVILFMLTPVFWEKKGLTGNSQWIADLNPLFHLVEIGRRPLLGQYAAIEHWIASAVIAVLSLVIGFVVFSSMRRRIYYWL